MSSATQAPEVATPRVERRRRRGLRVALRVAFTTLIGAWSLLLIAWLTLQWGIVPRVDQWRPQIEQRASAALGVPVSIGAIRVQSSGWMPLFQLDEVVLAPRGEQGHAGEALRLPRVSATLSARSLLSLNLRFEQLHVDGAALEVRRTADGRLYVAGIEVRSGEAGVHDTQGRSGTDWLLAQREIVVRNGRVRWVDEQSNAPPLDLEALDLVIRNGLAKHEIRLDATPPAALGRRFTLQGSFRQPLLAARNDWQRWSGTAHLDFPQADASVLRQWLPALPVDAAAGTGALRAWIDLDEGRPQAVQLDVALRDVLLRFPGHSQQLPLDRLQGRVTASREAGTLRLAAAPLSLTGGGVDVPALRSSLALRERDDGTIDGGEFSADLLDLAALSSMAAQLPLGDALSRLLAELAPQGRVRNLSARWDGPLDAPRAYRVKAQAQGLSVAARPNEDPLRVGRPGWRNAAIDFEATEQGGRAQLSLNDGALIFPGVFEQPEVPFDALSTRLSWRITPQAGRPADVEVTLADTQFANADAQGRVPTAVWRTGPGSDFARGGRFPGRIELAAQLSRGKATSVARYLPQGIPETARRYVANAVRDGKVAEANVALRGDLFDFPFVPYTPAGARAPVVPAGEFRIAGRVQDVELAYVPAPEGQPPAWPAFSRVSGELVFERASMEIRNAQARLWDVELGQVNGGIRELHRPVLKIEGNAKGPAADLLRYVNATPVAGWTANALRDATASGAAELKLALELPIQDLARSTVQGNVQLAGNDVRLTRSTPLLAAARARVAFTHKGFSVTGGSASVMGGALTFDGGMQADGALRFNGQGSATAEGLRQAGDLGPLAKLAAAAAGSAPYRLALGFVRGRSEFTLTSPLTGMALNLPAPMKKPADVAWPLRVETRVAADGPLRDTLRVELAPVLSATYQRDLSRDDGVPQVTRGAVGVLEPAPSPPDRGVHAVLALPAVDADAWQALLDRPATAATGAAAGAADADAGYLPRTVALRAQSLVSGGRRLDRLVLGISRDPSDGTWRGNIDADQIGGYVEYRAGTGPSSPGRVYARLARLALPPAEASSVENLLAEAPTTVPAVDIVIDAFELRGKKLGRVELEAVNRGSREWRLNRLALTNPEAKLVGTGQWQAGSSPRMVLDFNLDLADSGAFLDRLGFAGTLKGGKGRLGGQVSWAGSPLAFHIPSLDGKLNLSLDAGQFLKAGPGAARLLSVLSLQALPRRLALDFRDLFQEGFAFDNVGGEVTIDDGVAATRNLRMRGVQAAVLMEGNADLQHETQDLRVFVVPEINAGTASLAYAVINPAVGLGSFIAQLFLRRPLMAASTREFTVQGSWADPKVERVERKLGEPLPDLDGPPQPASAPASAPRPAS